ncbi:MAG TPA: hypothetical protein VGK88_10805 [bacterium]
MSSDTLPTRFHIGLQRAASTYFYDLLASHPDAALPRKGLGYYSNKFERGMDWYLAQFPPGGLRIDPSPVYFVRGGVVAPRINAALGGTAPRFVLMLRNPIDYTVSRFLLHRRIQGLVRRFGNAPGDLATLLRDHPEYLDESRFGALLERHWFPRFDRACFHIVLFEDFTRDQAGVSSRVLDFLGLSPHTLKAAPSSRNATLRHPVLHSVKAAIVARPRLHAVLRGNALIQGIYDRFLVARAPKVLPAQRAWLRGLLAADVARLKVLLADPLTAWKDFLDD